jgi:hypothetical protein
VFFKDACYLNIIFFYFFEKHERFCRGPCFLIRPPAGLVVKTFLCRYEELISVLTRNTKLLGVGACTVRHIMSSYIPPEVVALKEPRAQELLPFLATSQPLWKRCLALSAIYRDHLIFFIFFIPYSRNDF